MTDISGTLAPKSDQQNFDDYELGPKTVTVSGTKVIEGDQQPVHVELTEYPGRPFKPNKSMRRVLAKAWGPGSKSWTGGRLTLFGNPAVTYGGKAVGGIEIAAMSRLEGPLSIPLTVRRGRREDFVVQPLAETTPTIPQEIRDTAESITDAATMTEYSDHLKGRGAPAHILEFIEDARKAL